MTEKDLRKALELALDQSGSCPDTSALYRFAAGLCGEEERRRLDEHLLPCASCMAKWKDLRALIKASRESGLKPPAPPPTVEEARAHRGPSRHSWVPATIAAGFIVCLFTAGWSLLHWVELRGENTRLTRALVLKDTGAGPSLGALLDLSPESLRLRGGETVTLKRAGAGETCVLLLNALAPYEGPVTVSLRGGDGQLLWRTDFKETPPSPITLLVPTKLLSGGGFTVEVASAGQVLDRYPFRVE